MKRIWQQSPDGRAVAVDGDLRAHSVEGLERMELDEPRIKELEPFIEGCWSVLPEPPEEGRVRVGFVLFVLGAIDRFWTIQDLDDRRFQPYAETLLRRFGLDPEQAATTVAALSQLPSDPLAKRTMVQGGDALETWLQSRDPNVPLRLTELIAEWRRG